ncbi:FHA domain-containing protein [Streptomyces crystallinus]|uniref:FHA domain-containing protein n=1 Tax=Streptomyces crystallinus TaxID=68191 RepID=A0ABN1GD54_9ACTN
MQIRLTVLAPRSGHAAARACDVLVTAPAGTALAAVASGLATAASGSEAPSTVVLYAGRERLDPQRRVLGEPPLVDGAVLSLSTPADSLSYAYEEHAEAAPARLCVVAGPDAGGVHLLHGGQIRVGRSADADVPLDDPDVSRLHCAVTVGEGGRVSVADLGSTNGTRVDSTPVGPQPVRLPVGALLRLGESTLRLSTGTPSPQPLPTAADGEGHIRVIPGPGSAPDGGPETARVPSPRASSEPGPGGHGPTTHGTGSAGAPGPAEAGPTDVVEGGGRSHGRPEEAFGQGRTEGGFGTYGGVPGVQGGGVQGGAAEARGGASGAPGGADGGRGHLAGAGPAEQGYGPGASDRTHGAQAGSQEPGRGAGGAYGAGADGRTHAAGAGADGRAHGAGGQGYDSGADGRAHGAGAGGRTSGGGSGTQGYDAGADGRTHGAGAGADGRAHGAGAGGRTSGGGSGTQGYDAGADGRTHGAGGWAPGGGAGGQEYRPATDGRAPGDSSTGPGRGQGTSRRVGTPPRGTRMPEDVEHARVDDGAPARRRGGIGAWARRLTGGRAEAGYEPEPAEAVAVVPGGSPAPERWPDPAALLLTALGPGPRLWERRPGHPEELAIRVGTADHGELAAVPVTVGLREVGSLGLAGPRARLNGLARAAVAQLAALHAPADLEIVLISTERGRSLQTRTAEWGWLGWLPHVRPGHGQDCRLLLAYDREQATARTTELVRRLDDSPLGPGWASADAAAVADATRRYSGPYTVVVVDGDPGSSVLRETTARLASAGGAAGIHLLCLAETPPASPVSPVEATYESACAVSLPFRECGAAALLSGDVATALRLLRTAGGRPAGHGTLAVVDAVSPAWAERFARALAPLRAGDGTAVAPGRPPVALPPSSRLLDELGLARATPASLMARWESAPDGAVVLGAGPRGPVGVDLASDGPHLLVEGPAGSGRTELLRAVAASLAAGARPDRLALVLVDGAGGERGEGLRPCTELPHVSTHLVASDPVRMREFAQALGAELKRRAELLGELGFAQWLARQGSEEVAGRVVSPRPPSGGEQPGEVDAPSTSTLRLRPLGRTRTEAGPPPLARLVILVDDFDALVAPALGSPGRPAAGSVVRALEAVARDGERLGVHLVATSARPERTAETELARGVRQVVRLDAPPLSPSPEEPSPGRGRLFGPDGSVTPFQGGRVTGRIPRTATLRPTVVPLEWERMGDPPARRPVRELGNGPTDLALLASALDRAGRVVHAAPPAGL